MFIKPKTGLQEKIFLTKFLGQRVLVVQMRDVFGKFYMSNAFVEKLAS